MRVLYWPGWSWTSPGLKWPPASISKWLISQMGSPYLTTQLLVSFKCLKKCFFGVYSCNCSFFPIAGHLLMNAEPKKEQLGPSLIVSVEHCDCSLNVLTTEGNWQYDFNHQPLVINTLGTTKFVFVFLQKNHLHFIYSPSWHEKIIYKEEWYNSAGRMFTKHAWGSEFDP